MRTAAIILSVIGIILFAGCKKNHAPDTPAVPSGPTSCAVGVEYTFSSSATDPDGDSVSIRFDWGDGDTSEWSQYVSSGDTVEAVHSWLAVEAASLRAQSRDGRGAASPWTPEHSLRVISWWGRTFGGADDDEGYCVEKTQDGGYILTGRTYSYAAKDSMIWLVKTDSDGSKLWDKTLRGLYGSSVKPLPSGGYIVAGVTASGGGMEDVCLTRTDGDGRVIWEKSLGGQYGDQGYCVELTRDGGFIVSGSTWSYGAGSYDVWLIKTDSLGNRVWDKTFGGSSGDWGYSVRQTSDGGYIVVSTTESYGAGSSDAWLIKTDSAGHKVWDQTYGGSGEENAYSVQQTSDAGYIIVGSTRSAGAGGSDVWLVKTDASGNEVWASTFGGELDDGANSAQMTSGGGVVVVGETESFGAGDCDMWLLEIDGEGGEVWDMAFGGEGLDYGASVLQASDGGFVVAGTSYSCGSGGADVWLAKVKAGTSAREGGRKGRSPKGE